MKITIQIDESKVTQAALKDIIHLLRVLLKALQKEGRK